ncbi:lipoprotein insertase outer membrane protein LolB [Aquabacterium sp. NJ1]|uniref:lipoprotein insertase outer membrane protein LolB n=1 Tax=Aquabacterium sp. NJ1 TaxID=1538295 RepID=UPI000689348F|nr:lipoprotein insertase outer membrane protein LolB [Aquabacterium sp. NJ1]
MRSPRALARALCVLCPLMLQACASVSEGDPIVAQMRSGGACAAAEASSAPGAPLPAQAAEARPPARALPRIDLQGQMSVKLSAFADQPAKGLSLGFFFSGNTDTGQLDLMTLMGSQMAQVNWQPGEAWLVNDKGRARYDNLDSLSEAALGEPLPLRQLVHWMQGHPDPELPSAPGPETDTFTQQGWLIDARELPIKKLNARREATPVQRGVQLKIYLDR